MTGEVPAPYAGRLWRREAIDGIVHHWVWTPGGIHRSRLHRLANYAVFAVAAGLRAAALARPDVVLVSSPPLTVGPLGPFLARRFGCPWLLEVRDIWPESAVSVGWLHGDGRLYALLETLARRLAAGARAVVVPTPGLEPLVRAHGARRVVTLTGIVEPRPPDPRRRAAVRERLGVSDAECVFLYLGAIGVANGLDLLVEAVGMLPADVPARVVIAGDGSARRALESAVAEHADRIVLLPPLPKDEVDGVVAAADVGLHLLRPDRIFESALPTKVLDYLGAGLPFLTTTAGIPAEVAGASGGSFAATVGELAAELERWARMDPAELTARGARARSYGAAHFGLEESVTRLERLFEEVLEPVALAAATP